MAVKTPAISTVPAAPGSVPASRPAGVVAVAASALK
jgi:hypothetical protein